MKKLLFGLVLGVTICTSLVAQRNLEVVAQPFNNNVYAIATDGYVIIAEDREQYLLKYNDISASRYDYPAADGARLRFTYHYPMATLGSSTYLVLNGGGSLYLYGFNGGRFSRIVIPGSIVSNAVTFRDNLYILSRTASIVRLYRFNGSTVTEVPSGYLPAGGSSGSSYELRVENNQLYLMARNLPGAFGYVMRRYDGTTFFNYPFFEFPSHSEIIPIGETGSAYFLSDGGIQYFNGTTIRRVFFDGVGFHINAANWRDNLYFLHWDRSTFTTRFRRTDGTTVTEIPLPAGMEIITQSNLVVYNDALYMLTRDGAGDEHLLRYDGLTYSSVFSIPVSGSFYARLLLRDGNLIVFLPAFDNMVYEYDGSIFTTIHSPAPQDIFIYLAQTNCNHLWATRYHDDAISPLPLVGIYKESKSCPPPPPAPVIVIPRYFFPLETFNAVLSTKGDRECWSDVVVDWVIDPICPVPEICPDPIFQLAFSDAQGNIGFQQKFDKPINTSIPLDGKLPFTTTLSSVEKDLKNLIIIDQELVQKGITRIAFRMKPKAEGFQLAAATKPGTNVVLKVTLLNKEGKSIWEKEFTAPFNEIIKDRVAEPGETLHFSVVPSQEEINTKIENSTSFTYLNPSHGSLSINVKDKEENAEADLMITTILGQKLVSKRIKTPASVRVELPEHKAGLYVISIQTKDGRKTNTIVWLK